MRLPYTTRILGTLLMLFSSAQLFPGFLAYFFDEKSLISPFIITGFLTFFIGFILFFLASKKKGDLRTKDGFIITIFFRCSIKLFIIVFTQHLNHALDQLFGQHVDADTCEHERVSLRV